jgi:hypothetical protein
MHRGNSDHTDLAFNEMKTENSGMSGGPVHIP